MGDSLLHHVAEIRSALQHHISADLQRALDAAPSTALGAPLSDGADYVRVLVDALMADWHHSHETIAQRLQALRLEGPEEALFATATRKFPYLEYDDSHALARKCVWALADIGTPTARAYLTALTGSADSEVAGYARRRLGRWHVEQGRKGPPK